ncbi:hypothetical protein GOBAR_AA37832 [Gossypium barbadense]|uniref:Uncharacterized protein n=1 Tax=Gossypium barbadense TaxID=3634 RepID=A0A2P5VVK7_GOSBA|nr:hypothetical protein GOBAR_AA37832 [Gossypium barbadense]
MSSSFTPDETAPFFGFLGRAAALVWRAPYGTAKSGAGVASMGVMRPELLWPVLGIYGSLLLYQLSAGMAIGIVGDAGVRYGALIPPMFLT